MIKFVLCLLAAAVAISAFSGLLHLYRVSEKNKKEMAMFSQKRDYDADLGKVLVIYYSYTGYTQKIAEEIAAQTNGDLYEIKTKEAYTNPSVYVKSRKQLSEGNYPELSGSLPELEGYDTIFVGGPVWWYTMAPPLYSLLDKLNFNKKRVVPFSTQGSNPGTFFDDFYQTAHNAHIQSAEKFNNLKDEYDEAVKNKITAWLNRISM